VAPFGHRLNRLVSIAFALHEELFQYMGFFLLLKTWKNLALHFVEKHFTCSTEICFLLALAEAGLMVTLRALQAILCFLVKLFLA